MKEHINDYRIIDIIGEGAFAKVYHVEGPDNKQYALKMIGINQQNKEKIREEGILIASMKH
jgi:serine/threonine protein kinase